QVVGLKFKKYLIVYKLLISIKLSTVNFIAEHYFNVKY
ncbi:Uncharacterized protein NV38_0002861, partial [Leptospira kirschneri serovar Mozdok]